MSQSMEDELLSCFIHEYSRIYFCVGVKIKGIVTRDVR